MHTMLGSVKSLGQNVESLWNNAFIVFRLPSLSVDFATVDKRNKKLKVAIETFPRYSKSAQNIVNLLIKYRIGNVGGRRRDHIFAIYESHIDVFVFT